MIILEQLRKIDKRIKYKSKTKKIKSPGQRYRHYSPKAKVKISGTLIKGLKDLRIAYIGIKKPTNSENFYKIRVSKNLNDYAKNLFSFFRECDDIGIKVIYAEKVPEKGIGLAIMNRLKKAAYS